MISIGFTYRRANCGPKANIVYTNHGAEREREDNSISAINPQIRRQNRAGKFNPIASRAELALRTGKKVGRKLRFADNTDIMLEIAVRTRVGIYSWRYQRIVIIFVPVDRRRRVHAPSRALRCFSRCIKAIIITRGTLLCAYVRNERPGRSTGTQANDKSNPDLDYANVPEYNGNLRASFRVRSSRRSYVR